MYTLCPEKKYLVLPQENLRDVTNQAFLVKQPRPRIVMSVHDSTTSGSLRVSQLSVRQFLPPALDYHSLAHLKVSVSAASVQ